MTPFAQAAEAHLSLGSDWPFAALVEAHAQNGGYCVITPEVFLLGRPIRACWTSAEIADPRLVSPDPDCWHCWLFAGDLAKLLGFLPYPLPFVSFHRRGKLRVLTLEAAKRLLR